MAIAIVDYIAKLCPEMPPLQEDGEELTWINLSMKSSVSFWSELGVLQMSIQNHGRTEDHYWPSDEAIAQAAKWILGKDPTDKPPESPHKSASSPPADSPRTAR